MTAATATQPDAPTLREHGNAYNIFILVLTIQSLLIMVLLLLPLDPAMHQALFFFDNFVCFIFLADFLYNITGSRPASHYFIHGRGWLDLLGSIPSFGFFQFTALLRLARLSRLARITRLLGGQNRKALVEDVVKNRGQYAFFITFLAAYLVLTIASVLVLWFEGNSPDANITTGGDALWWGLVTITTVGYGDFYPVTPLGRATGVFVMFAGVGIIGSLASILASILVPSADEVAAADNTPAPAAAPETAGAPAQPATAGIEGELAAMRGELAAMRALLAERAT